LWAHSYERDLQDILALQSEVAQAITNEIQVNLAPQHWEQRVRAWPANRQAYEAYLRGRYCWNKRTGQGIRKSIHYLRQAIAHDPDYALAHAGLADGYRILAVCGWLAPIAARDKALAAAHKALEIDELLSEAHKALGAVRFRFDWEWNQSETELQRALELNSSDADAHRVYALCLQATGRVEQAIAEVERARDLDPLSLLMETALGRALYLARRYEAAIAQCRKALELDPDYVPAHFNLGRVLVEAGKTGEAISELKKAGGEGGISCMAALGYAYSRAGEEKGARAVLKELEKLRTRSYVSAYEVAKVHVGLGQMEQALEWLQKAYTERAVGLVALKVDPVFEPLHSHPAFQELGQRMRLQN
jgi:tetratricopeptide (TPR) repeat protein